MLRTDVTMPEPADVQLVDVTKRFGGVVAVESLNLTYPSRNVRVFIRTQWLWQDDHPTLDRGT
jgi:hypothetical protein